MIKEIIGLIEGYNNRLKEIINLLEEYNSQTKDVYSNINHSCSRRVKSLEF